MMHGFQYEEFKSQLIRSFQDAYGIEAPEVKECRQILESPVGEVIIRAALLAASKK